MMSIKSYVPNSSLAAKVGNKEKLISELKLRNVVDFCNETNCGATFDNGALTGFYSVTQ